MGWTTIGVGIASGLSLGSIYALVALSFALVVLTTSYFNFALESLVSLGGIAAFYLLTAAHLGLPLTALIVCVGGVTAGVALELVGHRTLENRARDVATSVLLATIGISIAIDGGTGALFGGTPRQVPSYVPATPFTVLGVPIKWEYVVTVAVVIVVAAVLEVVTRRTAVGRFLRATQNDKEGAALLGQNVRVTTAVVFGVAGLLAAVAGFLVTPTTLASASAGSSLLIPAFAALAIGGFGSFRGAIGGGLIIGLFVGLVPLKLPVAVVNPLLLLLIVAILLVRPRGLFGATGAREL